MYPVRRLKATTTTPPRLNDNASVDADGGALLKSAPYVYHQINTTDGRTLVFLNGATSAASVALLHRHGLVIALFT